MPSSSAVSAANQADDAIPAQQGLVRQPVNTPSEPRATTSRSSRRSRRLWIRSRGRNAEHMSTQCALESGMLAPPNSSRRSCWPCPGCFPMQQQPITPQAEDARARYTATAYLPSRASVPRIQLAHPEVRRRVSGSRGHGVVSPCPLHIAYCAAGLGNARPCQTWKHGSVASPVITVPDRCFLCPGRSSWPDELPMDTLRGAYSHSRERRNMDVRPL